jgi:RHS repeat-associated protein
VTVTNDYAYDRRRLLTAESLSVPGQIGWVFGYGYDANGHLSVRYTPSGQDYYYSPDALGRPTQLYIPNVNTYVNSVGYYPDGHIASFVWKNGLTHSVTENARGLPYEIHDSATGNEIEDLTYAYDNDGNPLQVTDRINGARTATLAYDGLNRLTSAILAASGPTATTYSYNTLDQITQTAQGTHTRSFAYRTEYGRPDELETLTDSQSGTTSYSYDSQGNLATRNGVQYGFDYGNRLRDVSGLEGGYLYDAYGRRVGQTNSSGTIWSFYDHSGQLVFQQTADGTTHDYLYLGGHLVAIRDYDTQGIARVMRYQHTDAEGSILRQTDANANLIAGADYVYDAYGKQVSGSAHDGPGYTGHVMDASTGLTYMQQRYYDPDAMRFLSMDPVEADSAGGNLGRYWYANDNPYKYIDPDGRTCTRVGKSYSCVIDKVATQVNGKTVIRNATAADHKTYAAVEKSLTQAVNAAATSGKTANISFESGGTNYSFSISGTSIANNMAVRVINVDPSESGAMNTVGNTTTVDKSAIQPGRTIFGNADRTRQVEFLHEAIHQSREEDKALGRSGLIQMGVDQDAHQAPYNAAANSFLGPIQ